jgi:hypothetical protein
MHSTSKILVCIVELFFEAGDWKGMQENIVMLSKRRGQLKAVCYNGRLLEVDCKMQEIVSRTLTGKLRFAGDMADWYFQQLCNLL